MLHTQVASSQRTFQAMLKGNLRKEMAPRCQDYYWYAQTKGFFSRVLAMSKPTAVIVMLLMAAIQPSSASFMRHDHQCVRNIGCEGEFTDVIMGVQSARTCQIMCDEDPTCNYFTWFSAGIFQYFCFRFPQCGMIDFDCLFCYSGPQSHGCLNRING